MILSTYSHVSSLDCYCVSPQVHDPRNCQRDKWAEALETCWDLPMTHLDTGTCLLTPPALPSSLQSGWSTAHPPFRMAHGCKISHQWCWCYLKMSKPLVRTSPTEQEVSQSELTASMRHPGWLTAEQDHFNHRKREINLVCALIVTNTHPFTHSLHLFC